MSDELNNSFEGTRFSLLKFPTNCSKGSMYSFHWAKANEENDAALKGHIVWNISGEYLMYPISKSYLNIEINQSKETQAFQIKCSETKRKPSVTISTR